MLRKYVTSMSRRQFDTHGETMLEGFCKHWPKGNITVYTEAGELPFKHERVSYKLLYEIPGLAYFLEGVQHFEIFSGVIHGKGNYQYNVNAFARKAYAQMAAAEGWRGHLFWIDADVTTYKSIPGVMLDGFMQGSFIALMKRKTWHPCTSFVGWDCGHPYAQDWWAHYRNVYQAGHIFLLPQWEDCTILASTLEGMDKVRDLGEHITDEGPINIFDTVFNGYAKHDKGMHKIAGRYNQLLAIVEKLQPKRILEIGTWNGGRAIEMAKAAGGAEYIGFDLFETANEETDEQEKNVKKHYSMEVVKQRLSDAGVNHVLYMGDSKQTVKEFLKEYGPCSVDLAFIDGGHSIETIREDLQNVKQAVKPGGVIIMDDYYSDLPGEDMERYGAQAVLSDEPHIVLPIKDWVKGGGKVQMAVVEC